jgi:hypothetical protein
MTTAATPETLTAVQQLDIALQTMNTVAGWVTNADTKIATLSAVQAGLALFMAAQPVAAVVGRGGVAGGAGITAITLFGVAFLASIRHLGEALRPRLSAGPALNHFAFPSVARAQPAALGHASADALLYQAWAHAHVLSVIAVTRFRHFSRALVWTGAGVLAVLGWLGSRQLGQ